MGLADIFSDSDVLVVSAIPAVIIGLLTGLFVYAGAPAAESNVLAIASTVVVGAGIFVLASIGLGGLRSKYPGRGRTGSK